MGSGVQPNYPRVAHPAFTRFSPLRHSPGFNSWVGRRPYLAYPEASEVEPALPQSYLHGTGILTGFPFGGFELRPTLGPADPRLTTHCRGTLALSAAGILTRLCCYYRRDLQSWPVHWTSRPSFWPARTPPYRITSPMERCPEVSAAGLSPVHFRGLRPRRVSCYALFKGWLLLSLPPRCLRPETPFELNT